MVLMVVRRRLLLVGRFILILRVGQERGILWLLLLVLDGRRMELKMLVLGLPLRRLGCLLGKMCRLTSCAWRLGDLCSSHIYYTAYLRR